MKGLESYPILYPRIPIEIVLFFSKHESINNKLIPKTIIQFCNYYSRKYSTEKFIQPKIISTICEKLVANNTLSLVNKAGVENSDSSYIGIIHNSNLETDLKLQDDVNQSLSLIIYGFPYIYEKYKNYVLPVEYTSREDKISLGTCFLYNGGIVSAKHCFEGAKTISIQGFNKKDFENASFKIHENELMDLIFIKFDSDIEETIIFGDEANVLDEVITLGYPKIAGYHNFLSTEKATVSSRFTATTGQIAASAEDIWIREKLFLITAKIRGGNSGGPVINQQGAVVGVSVNMSTSEGDYDDLGYGTVIPISYVDEEIIKKHPPKLLSVNNIDFKDFI